MTMAPLKTFAAKQVRSSLGRQRMDDMPGAQGLSWTD